MRSTGERRRSLFAMIGIDPSAPRCPYVQDARRRQHRSAAEKLADEEIEEIPVTPAAAEEELGCASGRRIIAQCRRIRARSRNFTFHVKARPGAHCALRRADLRFPAPQLKRSRDAKADDPPLLRGGEGPGRATTGNSDKIEAMFWCRKRVAAASALTNGATKIDQHQIAATPSYFEPERISAFRIDRHRDRGCPTRPRRGPPALIVPPLATGS